MDKKFISESLLSTFVTAITAGGLGAAVGYNHAKLGDGKEDEYMPHLGPVPADLGVVGGGFLVALLAQTMGSGSMTNTISRVGMATAAGGLAVFAVSSGQSAGEQLYDSMNGSGAIAPSAQRREFRGADGRFRAVAADEWPAERVA